MKLKTIGENKGTLYLFEREKSTMFPDTLIGLWRRACQHVIVSLQFL